MSLESLFAHKPLDLSTWEAVRTEDPYFHDGVLIPHTEKRVYEKVIDGETVSLGAFYFEHSLAFVAWGLKDEALCSHHAIIESDGGLSQAINSCPEFTVVRKEGGVAGFSLRAFKRTYVWEGEATAHPWWRVLKTYTPLILVLGFVILLTIGWSLYENATKWNRIAEHFMAFFFLVFGLLKVPNLKRFAEMYATYDILANRSRIYALSYPFIEIVLGILMFKHFYPAPLHFVVFILMMINAVGVARMLSKKQEVLCACLGTWFKLPLTKVTLYENLIMGGMAFVELIRLI